VGRHGPRAPPGRWPGDAATGAWRPAAAPIPDPRRSGSAITSDAPPRHRHRAATSSSWPAPGRSPCRSQPWGARASPRSRRPGQPPLTDQALRRNVSVPSRNRCGAPATAVGNAMVTRTPAPFTAVGRLFSRGDEKVEEPKIDPVTFAAGSSVLSSPAMEAHVLRVADLLRRSPCVNLTLRAGRAAATSRRSRTRPWPRGFALGRNAGGRTWPPPLPGPTRSGSPTSPSRQPSRSTSLGSGGASPPRPSRREGQPPGPITFEVIDLLASRVDDAHGRVAVNLDPTASSARLSAARAALLGLGALEASPDHARAPSAMRDELAAGVLPSTVAPRCAWPERPGRRPRRSTHPGRRHEHARVHDERPRGARPRGGDPIAPGGVERGRRHHTQPRSTWLLRDGCGPS
jgi:hypothetical protein